MIFENVSDNLANNNSDDDNEYLNIIFDLQLHNHQISSLFDDTILINNRFQIFISLILCIVSLIGALFHIGFLIRRYFSTKSFSHYIFVQSLFDICHLINILFTHMIFIIVYVKTSTNIDISCPVSTFFFSIVSFGSISFLCLGAFNRYLYSFKKQSQCQYNYHRLLAHRFILITTISWLLLNFPKVDFK